MIGEKMCWALAENYIDIDIIWSPERGFVALRYRSDVAARVTSTVSPKVLPIRCRMALVMPMT